MTEEGRLKCFDSRIHSFHKSNTLQRMERCTSITGCSVPAILQVVEKTKSEQDVGIFKPIDFAIAGGVM